jgi:NADH-quinone oxidoreductase E subunit
MSTAFEFTPENREKFEAILKRYPRKRAAMLPALHLVQEQNGFISPEVEEYVAEILEVPVVDVREVISFYSLFIQQPVGRHHIKVCNSLSCWVRGCEEVKEYLKEKLGIEDGEMTADGKFSWESVPDCLGACELAPMFQIDGYFEGPLTKEKIDELLKKRLDS